MRRVLVLAATAACALAGAVPAAAQTAHTRIVSGDEVSKATYPFQIELRYGGRFICGGSILDAETVVTAAHCVTHQEKLLPHNKYPAANFTVGYGSAARSSSSLVGVDSIDVPTEYVNVTDESFDVAILHLSSPIAFGPGAQPIPIANAAQSRSAGSAIVTGWGDTTENGNVSPTLLGTRVTLRTDDVCGDIYGSDYVPERAVCAGGGPAAADNPDTCQGDSGGPLAVNLTPDAAAPSFVLLGLTSFGDGCGERNTPGVYTWLQGTGIEAFVSASEYESSVFTSGDFGGGIPGSLRALARVAQAPAPQAAPVAARDVTRPTVAYSKLSCTRRHRCTFRLKASDNSGVVKSLAASASRKVRTCTRTHGRKRCRITTRRKRLRVARVTGGFVATGTLARARYTLTAYATDATGNRSKVLTKSVRVP